jgi:F-type H+-transporting ATPase subunit epsilon
MAQELTLRVITPEKVLIDTTATSVQVPATDGSMGVFPRHAAMIAALGPGHLTFNDGKQSHDLFVAGGFAEVHDNTLRILTPAGEEPSEIDEERAKEAEVRARARLKPSRTDMTADEARIDIARANAALHRALMRLKVKGHAR